MSNTTVIAAVTGALQDLLIRALAPQFPGEPELSDATVSTMPLDAARPNQDKSQLNLFLFQVAYNPSWRNLAATTQGAVTETMKPPLALDLHYLLTASGKGEDDLLAHLLLGRATAALQAQAILTPNQLLAAARSRPSLAASNAHLQAERIRVTPRPMTTDEMARVWGMFQAKYRLSVAYQVGVVLIDPSQPPPMPLPVLSRGTLERGQAVFADLGARNWPGLLSIELPALSPAASLGIPGALRTPAAATDTPGDVLGLSGFSLLGSAPQVVLRGLPGEYVLPAPLVLSQEDGRITVQLPVDQASLPAGPYQIFVRLTKSWPGDDTPQVLSSNQLPLAVAPQIVSLSYQPEASGTPPRIALRCSPQVWPGQSVSLLLGEREILPEPPLPPSRNQRQPASAKLQDLRFTLSPPLPAGRYTARLRVDGVESFPLRRDGTTPTSFDPGQQVIIP